MQVEHTKIPLSQAASFPKLFIDYLDKKDSLKPFYTDFPDIEGFKNSISNRTFENREVLVQALKNQYNGLQNSPDFDILLNDKTFTVTTGHQLNIFTGPLYVIYKIVSTINLAKKLKASFPDYNFVPVYWMATEDHDFEEISYFNLFGQKHVWETEQKGGVGRMDPSGLLKIIEGLRDRPEVFEKAYSENATLGAAVRQYMHELFGSQGLFCIDGDDRLLKGLFSQAMQNDLFEHTAESAVVKISSDLEHLGYKTQIHARNINFFYLENNLRERIEIHGDKFTVLNTDISFSKEELLEIIEKTPEKLSPNVVLRPLYQETILPNLAYLGGPSEVSYWLQLKGIFDDSLLPFPILLPRNLALAINEGTLKRMDKLGVKAVDLFLDEVSLKRNFVEKNSEHSLSLEKEIAAIESLFDDIAQKAIEVDATLKAVIESEKVKNSTALGHLEKRIKKAEEKKFETSLNQLQGLKDKLFPGGGLQERSENFLNFYLNDPEFIQKISSVFDPLDFNFNIINV
ncbi:bacillithiol biosynthesis cysteine-adding enzyme BshC [Lacihabitans sp. LS3-19]|uniref:bacillithiol biosynthesis cysteine-adding enzyme BshC n=1 Tax=Lacihabitans sp. LS3-19 TaxID=2487335 RepID=UPI0020CF8088|nr:bacillithiol biosynthesis cysteine-adding enzyme BshC [Lacihabitans sp. LS3-19]